MIKIAEPEMECQLCYRSGSSEVLEGTMTYVCKSGCPLNGKDYERRYFHAECTQYFQTPHCRGVLYVKVNGKKVLANDPAHQDLEAELISIRDQLRSESDATSASPSPTRTPEQRHSPSRRSRSRSPRNLNRDMPVPAGMPALEARTPRSPSNSPPRHIMMGVSDRYDPYEPMRESRHSPRSDSRRESTTPGAPRPSTPRSGRSKSPRRSPRSAARVRERSPREQRHDAKRGTTPSATDPIGHFAQRVRDDRANESIPSNYTANYRGSWTPCGQSRESESPPRSNWWGTIDNLRSQPGDQCPYCNGVQKCDGCNGYDTYKRDYDIE